MDPTMSPVFVISNNDIEQRLRVGNAPNDVTSSTERDNTIRLDAEVCRERRPTKHRFNELKQLLNETVAPKIIATLQQHFISATIGANADEQERSSECLQDRCFRLETGDEGDIGVTSCLVDWKVVRENANVRKAPLKFLWDINRRLVFDGWRG